MSLSSCFCELLMGSIGEWAGFSYGERDRPKMVHVFCVQVERAMTGIGCNGRRSGPRLLQPLVIAGREVESAASPGKSGSCGPLLFFRAITQGVTFRDVVKLRPLFGCPPDYVVVRNSPPRQ